MRKLVIAFLTANIISCIGALLQSASGTTIIYDGNILATDSQTTAGDHKSLDRNKIQDANTHWIAGTGACVVIDKFVDLFKSHKSDVDGTIDELAKWEPVAKGWFGPSEVLIVNKSTGDASSVKIADSTISFNFNLPIPYATGSGGKYALGALLSGADPLRAIDIAKTIDLYSGGATHSVQLQK